MQVTIVNDTRADANPGCQATVTALSALVADTCGAAPVMLAHGVGHEYFARFDASRRHAAEAWRAAAALVARDARVVSALERSDLLVVNLEGTFHHHTAGALALGAIMSAANDRQVPVWAVNGTVDAIDPWLLDATLVRAAYVAVREPLSAQWLRSRGVRASLSADCAFLADVWAPVPDCDGTRRVLYTPGVLARPDQPFALEPSTVVAQLEQIVRRGWQPVYLEMDPDEDHVTAVVEARGWPVLRLSGVPWQGFGSFLRQFDLVVSGRYHVLVFAAMAGVRAIALASNTWKIDGLLELLGDSRGVVRDLAGLDARLGGPLDIELSAAALRRCRVLAHRNVTGHARARRRTSRVRRSGIVLSPFASRRHGGLAGSAHVPWPPRDSRRAALALAGALQARGARPWTHSLVSGLERLAPRDVPAVLATLRANTSGTIDVAIDSAPAAAWRTSHQTVRPIALWRELLHTAGFEVTAVRRTTASAEDGHGWTLRTHWRQEQPFRDALDRTPCHITVRPVAVGDDAEERMRTLLGLRRPADVPAVLRVGDGHVVFLVGTYQEFRQYLPIWETLPAEAYSVVVRAAPAGDTGGARRQAGIEAWLRSRGVEPIVVRAVKDIEWTAWPHARRVFVTGADSTAYDVHLWNAAVVVAARAHGFATVQLQHGIWPYADLSGPMTMLSDVVLSWSREFRDALEANVDWPDGSRGPRGVLGNVAFVAAGCPLFDAYADASPVRLEDLLGDWVGRYATRVLVATNLHWSQHAAGGRVTPAIVDLATRMPDTLFVLKPHPVHDPEPLTDAPANIVVVDELCCLAAGLDSTRLVRAVDAVIATQSTVVLEAALARKPCVVIDTGNPNRYVHVATVQPNDVDARLREALAAPSDVSAFRDYYYATSTLGRALDGCLAAIAGAAARTSPVDVARADVAIARFSGRLSTAMAELDSTLQRLHETWSERQTACASYDQQIERLQQAHRATEGELAWVRQAAIEDVGVFHARCVQLEAHCVQLDARCAELQRRQDMRERALLAPRPGRRVRVVLYGASGAGRECLSLVRSIPHLEARAFVDGDPAKWNTTMDGLPVRRPARAILKRADAVIVSSMHADAIIERIAELGAADRSIAGRGALERLALHARTA